MYLRGSRWSMNRRMRRPRIGLIFFLLVLIGIAIYINQFVVPKIPPPFIPTATPTLSPESFVNQAQSLFQEGKIDAAMKAYQEAISADPENVNNFIELARLQIFSNEYDEALKNVNSALLLNPNNPLAHAVESWAWNFKGEYGKAERAIREALEIDPQNALAHAYYAEILINQIQDDYGFLDKAITESKLALELGPDLLETHRVRGIVLLNTNNLDEAAQEFEKAISINKNIADLHLYLGVTYKAQEKYDLAQESLLLAYSLNPEDTAALIELSRAYFVDGRYAQASQYAEEAVKIEPENPHRHGYLGITYYKQELYDQAISELAYPVTGGTTSDGIVIKPLGLEYEDRIMQYYWYYGFALMRANRCGEAVQVFQALLTTVPDNEIATYNAQEGLSICKEQAGTPQVTATVEVTPQGEETATP
jgi:tetratricopeptide (TPR) repeat protein